MFDLDIRAFFDSVPHDLLLKAVAHHTERALGSALHRTVAQSPDADAGRDPRRPREGNPTGVSDLAVASQPVHALRVRPMDGPGVPGLPVRALRGRHRRPLRHRGTGPRASGRHRRAARGLGPRAAPRQDEDRVLQRHEPPRGRPSTPASTSSATPSGGASLVAAEASS